MIKKIGSGYMGFVVGLIFGSVIATLTSVKVFALMGGDLSAAHALGIHECLVQKLSEKSEDE